MQVMHAARIETLGQPGPVGAIEVLGGELVEGDLAELGRDPLHLEPVAADGRAGPEANVSSLRRPRLNKPWACSSVVRAGDS